MKRFIPHHSFEAVVCLLFALNAVLFIWLNRFLPLQDYPDWLFQGFLFFKAMTGKLLSGYRLVTYPVPNSISTFAIGVLNFIFSPETSGKIFLTGYVLLFAAGAVYLLNSLDPGRISPLSVVPAVLILNTPFFTGNINYVFGLGVLFFALGHLLRRLDDPARVNAATVSLLAVLLFFSHAIALFSLLLFMTVIVILRYSRRVLATYALAATPALILLVFYGFNHLHSGGAAQDAAGATVSFGAPQIKSLIAYFSIAQYFYPFTDASNRFLGFLGTANLIFCAALAAVFVWSILGLAKERGNSGVILVSATVLILLSLFSPRRFAGIINPGQRFLFPAAMLLLAAVAPRVNRHAGITAACRVSAVLLLLFQIFAMQGYAGSVSRRMQDMVLKLDPVWPERTVTFIPADDRQAVPGTAIPHRPLLPKQSPLPRLAYYLSIEHYVYTPIFPTGVIRDRGTSWPLQFAASIGEMRSFPDTVVLLGHCGANGPASRLLGPGYRTILEEQYCLVLRKDPGDEARPDRN